MSRMFQLRMDIVFNVIEQVLGVLIKLTILYLIIKGGGSSTQGQYKYIIDTAMLFNILSLFGMDNYNIYLMTKSFKEKSAAKVNAIITHTLIWISFTFVPILGLVYLLTEVFDALEPIVPQFVYLISIVALSFQTRVFIKNLWVGVGNIIFNSINQIVSDCVFLISMLYFYLNNSIDIYTIFIWYALNNFIFTLIILVQLVYRTKYRFNFDMALLKVQLKGGFQLFLYTIFFALMLRVDSLIIMKYLGSSSTGYYGIASQYSEFVYFIVIALSQIIIKETVLDRSDFIYKWLKKIQIIQLVLAIVLTCCTFILPLLLGEEYQKSVLPSIILLFGTYFWGIYIFFNYWLLGLNNLKYLVFTSIVGVCLNVILNLVLVRSIGIIGAAIASSISYFLTLILLIYLVKNKNLLKISFTKSLLPFHK